MSSLKTEVYNFLEAIVSKAKEEKDYILAMHKTEMAELVGKGTRTISRYINELQDNNIIKYKSRKGRNGGTIIQFNMDKIRFETNKNALVNADDPKEIDEVLNSYFPRKEEVPSSEDPNKRTRRTNQQILEDQLLQNEEQNEKDRLNNLLVKKYGRPDPEWFQETDDPTGNYKTYLLSRLYNRYAVLFTDDHNAKVDEYGRGNKLQDISPSYDVLQGQEFYGTSRWIQFDKLRKFLEENDIDPAVYLSVQFEQTRFTNSLDKNQRKSKKNTILPFVNALTSNSSYNVYIDQSKYQKKHSQSFNTFGTVSAHFASDMGVKGLRFSYTNAHHKPGFLLFKNDISDLYKYGGATEGQHYLMKFLQVTKEKLRHSDVSFKTKDTLKKYVIHQILVQQGVTPLSNFKVLGAELCKALLIKIDGNFDVSKEQSNETKALALGMMMHPYKPREEQISRGKDYVYQYEILNETHHVMNLIFKQLGIYLSVKDINEALKEFGTDNLPVNDFSLLDTNEIVRVMKDKLCDDYVDIESKEVNVEDIAIEDNVSNPEWEPRGAVNSEPNSFVNMLLEEGVIEDW